MGKVNVLPRQQRVMDMTVRSFQAAGYKVLGGNNYEQQGGVSNVDVCSLGDADRFNPHPVLPD